MNEQARNKRVIRELIEASDRGDLEAVGAHYAADYRDCASQGSRESSDRAGALATFAEILQAFPDTRHRIRCNMGTPPRS